MLTIYSPDQSSATPLSIPDDKWYVVHKYDGKDTLSFDISPDHECYPLIGEEIRVGTDKNRYIIKDIDEHGGVAQIDCEIDIDDWRGKVWKEFRSTDSLLSQVLNQICPEGWSISGASISSKRATVEASEGKPMEAVTPEEILYKAIDVYNVTVSFDVINRILYVIDPSTYTPSGEYFMKDLNLRSIGYNGSSSGFATRIYAWGKDDMTFASINNGKNYVENNSYSSRVVAIGWKDERYTVAANLLEAAKKKLESAAFPSRSYECDVANLSGDIWLHKVVTLIDSQRNTRVNHQVAEYKEYPKRRDLDVATLSTTPPKIESSIKKVYDDLKTTSEQNKSEMMLAIDQATKLMTGASGGHVVIRFINDIPEEILIMDTADMNTAKNVWRWNVNGFAHSSNGINGPYTTAITIDGKIIADFILSGTISANLIRGGVLQSQSGMLRFNLNSSTLYVYNADNTLAMRLDYRGQHFFERGAYLGKAGTNKLKSYPDMKGIEFDLDTNGHYMCWACKDNPDDTVYTIKFSFARDSVQGLDAGLCAHGDLSMGNYALNNVSNVIYNSNKGYPTALRYVSDGNYLQLAVNYGMSSQFYRGITLFDSDGRLKSNIRPTEINALNELMQWKHRAFEWKDSGKTELCGYIAQEMEQINPAYVLKVGEKGDEVYQMDERRLIPVLSKAIQELKEELDSLKNQINSSDMARTVSVPLRLSLKSDKEHIQQYSDTLNTKVEGPIPPSPPVKIEDKPDHTVAQKGDDA